MSTWVIPNRPVYLFFLSHIVFTMTVFICMFCLPCSLYFCNLLLSGHTRSNRDDRLSFYDLFLRSISLIVCQEKRVYEICVFRIHSYIWFILLPYSLKQFKSIIIHVDSQDAYFIITIIRSNFCHISGS